MEFEELKKVFLLVFYLFSVRRVKKGSQAFKQKKLRRKYPHELLVGVVRTHSNLVGRKANSLMSFSILIMYTYKRVW